MTPTTVATASTIDPQATPKAVTTEGSRPRLVATPRISATLGPGERMPMAWIDQASSSCGRYSAICIGFL